MILLKSPNSPNANLFPKVVSRIGSTPDDVAEGHGQLYAIEQKISRRASAARLNLLEDDGHYVYHVPFLVNALSALTNNVVGLQFDFYPEIPMTAAEILRAQPTT